jgi:hypothetical protein
MKKWFKRLMAVVSLLAILVALGVVALYYLANRAPEWIPQQILDPVARAAAAERAEGRLRSAFNLVQDAQSAETRARNANTSAPTTRPSLELSFTEEEINALFDKWDRYYQWRDRYGEHVSDPGIAFRDGKILLVGRAKELNKTISVRFRPRLDDRGRLIVSLDGIYSGSLWLPGVFEKYRVPLAQRVKAALPEFQRKARIDLDGSANGEAMAAAMSKLFLRILDDEPGDPVLFQPVGEHRSVPVKITSLSIKDKSLSMTVVPLTPDERKDLLARVREPYGTATASSD